MRDVSHANPRADASAVNDLFRRGPRVATDGGRRTAAEAEDEERRDAPAAGRTMKDVSHTPPDGDRHVNRVFERGGERIPERR